MKIYIPTSNKTHHLIEALLISLKKYWIDVEKYDIIILGYDRPQFKLDDNISFIRLNQSDDVKNWAVDLRQYFESIDDNYFIYMNDDCPLSRMIDNNILQASIQLAEMNPSGIGRICLTKCVSNRPHSVIGEYENFKIIEADQNSEYRTSVQFSIWSREYFIKNAKTNMSPWDFELQQAPKNDGWRILGTRGSHCLDFYHLMRKNGIPSNWKTSVHEKKEMDTNSDEYLTIKKIMGI